MKNILLILVTLSVGCSGNFQSKESISYKDLKQLSQASPQPPAGEQPSEPGAEGGVVIQPESFATIADLCLQPQKLALGVVLRCPDGSQVTGTHANLVACAADGELNCATTADFAAAATADLASKVLAGQTVAGVTGTGNSSSISACASDGETGCVANEDYPAANVTEAASKLLVGQILGGVSGTYTPDFPEASNVLSIDTVNGVDGTASLGSFSVCASDGATGCIASANYTAAATSGLASKVLSGQTVAGVSGSYSPDFPDVSNVRSADSTNGVSGTLADCSSDGSTDCVAVTAFKAVDMSLLVPANLKSGVTIASQVGNYPSAINPLIGSTGTDLPSLSSSVAAGAYQFFQSDGTRVTGSVSDAGTLTPTTSNQTLSASLYRTFTVAGDADLVAEKVLTGTTLFGVPGSVVAAPANCAADGATNCVAVSAYTAATTSGLASKVLSGQSVAGVPGNIVLPVIADVKSTVTYGISSGLTGTYSGGQPDCTTDGQVNCTIPATGNLKTADTTNFTGWDIRRKRAAGGSVMSFAGLTGQVKTCRNLARTGLWDYSTSPAGAGLDLFDTIDDYNNNATGLPTEVPPWTMPGVTGDPRNDFKCGGIYATGSTTSGNSGADATVAHDTDGNWQDLTPGIVPAGTTSTNTANGCNATDKHCVFRELISGLMVTERSATTYNWADALTYCHNLGEGSGAITSPIPIIGGNTYSDWRLPTQKEMMHLYNAGIRGLNATASLVTNYGDVDSSFWSSSSVSFDTTGAWYVYAYDGATYYDAKSAGHRAVCVR